MTISGLILAEYFKPGLSHQPQLHDTHHFSAVEWLNHTSLLLPGTNSGLSSPSCTGRTSLKSSNLRCISGDLAWYSRALCSSPASAPLGQTEFCQRHVVLHRSPVPRKQLPYSLAHFLTLAMVVSAYSGCWMSSLVALGAPWIGFGNKQLIFDLFVTSSWGKRQDVWLKSGLGG